MWDPATLATFARHYKTERADSAALVNRMRRASGVRQGDPVQSAYGQMVLARMSLSLHDRDPKDVDSTAMLRETTGSTCRRPSWKGRIGRRR